MELLQAGQGDRVLQDIDPNKDILMPILEVAKTGQTTPHTVLFLGKLGGQTLLILVDSRSSHVFISETVVVGLQSLVQIMPTILVKIATREHYPALVLFRLANGSLRGMNSRLI